MSVMPLWVLYSHKLRGIFPPEAGSKI